MENKLFEILSLTVTYLLCLPKLNYVSPYIVKRDRGGHIGDFRATSSINTLILKGIYSVLRIQNPQLKRH